MNHDPVRQDVIVRLLIEKFKQNGCTVTPREKPPAGQAEFIAANSAGTQPIFLLVACYENPFDPDDPPLACFRMNVNPDIYRAVMTRSPEAITSVVDEMLALREKQIEARG